ncbi:MAG: HEPN domain-containing protein [Deltaproteobacteria bacterium]|nr:HEPN domain-containing protein [Deltaproteobacteria bacterium]
MPRRHLDWLRQPKRKLQSARWNLQGKFFEDACFSSQQAAELAAKALLENRGRIELGHSVLYLLTVAGGVLQDLLDAGKVLDRYYIPTRYPNGFAEGAPMDYYDAPAAQGAIDYAQRIIDYVDQDLSRVQT